MSSYKNFPSSIDVKLKASHFNFVNKNAVLYTDNAVNKGLSSWIKPYKKPQIVGHDKSRDPIGRIIDATIIRSDSVDEPPDYIQLTARVTDKDSIEKILDGRFNTVSVGSRSSKVICSECDTVITEQGLCEHKKGGIGENGRPIYWIIDEIEYVENSFVNEPADEFAGIEEINIGNGFMAYNDFLDNRNNILEQLVEDMMQNTDAKLSAAQRNKLPDSAFCGPGRSFPAHDKSHVVAGLSLLDRSDFSDATKAKIKSCLYRKGKKYGIVPTEDELQSTPDILTARMADEFSDEEVAKVAEFFKQNPDSDLPETEDASQETTNNDSTESTGSDQTDIEKMKKEELKDLVLALQKQLADQEKANKEAVTIRDEKIKTIEKDLQDKETLILQKDEEIYKYLDETALLDKKFKDAIISNIIDLKSTDNTSEELEALTKKLSSRKIESLLDSLEDVRNEKTKVEAGLDTNKVVDPTITNDNSENTNKDQNNQENRDDIFSVFDRDRTSMEVE
jgi:hypothetical protein